MTTHIKVSLLVSAFMFLIWALGLMIEPFTAHTVLREGSYDSASVFMLGAASLGFFIIFFVTARNPDPGRDILDALATVLIIMSVISGLLLFASDGQMTKNVYNVISMFIAFWVGLFLFISRFQNKATPKSVKRSAVSQPKPKKKQARKKNPKKKVKKKTARKKRK